MNCLKECQFIITMYIVIYSLLYIELLYKYTQYVHIKQDMNLYLVDDRI